MKTIKDLFQHLAEKGMNPFDISGNIAAIYSYNYLTDQNNNGDDICRCVNPVPQATLSHACQNCYKILREYTTTDITTKQIRDEKEKTKN